ncbi:MAG: peptidylprolyl isomerase [Pyrinomonadaceae bacterium]
MITPAQTRRTAGATDRVPRPILLRIIKAEDERRWDNDLRELLADKSATVRNRAALAAGRIGSQEAVSELTRLLQTDGLPEVRAMSAFALGEIESDTGSQALIGQLKNKNLPARVRARVIEALGKIAGALPKGQETRAHELGSAIVDSLNNEAGKAAAANRQTILLGLTAVLRSKPTDAGPTLRKFFDFPDARVRADAANAIARLRLKDSNTELRRLVSLDRDPIVRANAVRALGASEDKEAFTTLLNRAINDSDSRVRISAIRALAALKDSRAVAPLVRRSSSWINGPNASGRSAQLNELLEIAIMLGQCAPPDDASVISWLNDSDSKVFQHRAPEIEIALVRVSPNRFLDSLAGPKEVQRTLLLDWWAAAGIAQGLGELANLPLLMKERERLQKRALELIRAMLDYRNSGLIINTLVAVHSEYAIPNVLRAFAAYKPDDLAAVLRKHLEESDVIIRSTAADLLAELPPSDENARALASALPQAFKDDLNDAALSIVDALGRQKAATGVDTLKTALDSPDYLIRRKAVAVLKTSGAGDFTSRIGTVQTRNTIADYNRALQRIGKPVRAFVTTSAGRFTIELLPAEAPLTVDNFINLAKRNYFRGITIHRVVANFVIQDGDPRGDGNGGPGYQIRCEINEVPYDRGAVGMALSGKDTGGSQWFVTHSPQPHLDGGYTVFGRVVSGMEVVDRIVRGDVIRSIVIAGS